MKISSAGLIVLIAVLAAACGRSASDPLAANLKSGRDLALSASGESSAAFASAVELNRTETQIAYEPKQPTSPPRPAPEPPPAETIAPPAEQPTPEAELEPVPVPVQEPTQVAIVPVASNVTTFAAPIAEPVANGTVVSLEPGQSVTILTSPISGATAENTDEMPATSRDGGMAGGEACPRGGRGGTRGGGVIGILR